MPYFINTSIYIFPFSARQPLISALRHLVPLHTFSQIKTTRLVIQMKAKIITFFNSNKKTPLYIRLSCCVKITQFQTKLPFFTSPPPLFNTLFNHPKTSKPLFYKPFHHSHKIFQLFIPVTPLSLILLHKKGHTLQCDQFLFIVQTFQLAPAIKSRTLFQTSLLYVLYCFITLFLVFQYFFLQYRK